MVHTRVSLSVATAVLCAAVVAVAGSAAATDPPLLLPDLVQEPPSDLSVAPAGDGEWVLGFRSAVRNEGAGPLVIHGRRASRDDPTMTGEQLVRRPRGGFARRPRVGELRYVRAADHRHWHLEGFQRYALRGLAPGAGPPRRDRKTGFCLGDRYRTRPDERVRFARQCGLDRPDLLRVREGSSPGFGDAYAGHVEGQVVGISGLPAGPYALEHRVNADRRLAEERYDNDASCLLIDLAWPRGPGRAPRIAAHGPC